MDAKLITGFNVSLTSDDNFTGKCNVGTRFADGKISAGPDVGLEGSSKNGGSVFIAGNAGYNAEEDLHGAYSNGIFLKARASYQGNITEDHDNYGSNYYSTDGNFTKYNAEAGIRINSANSTHQNISAFAEQVKKDKEKVTSFGGKLELSDGKKMLYGIAGIQKDGANWAKNNPFIGAGIQVSLSTK